MRDGKVVFETPAKDATVKALHQHMVGRQLHHEYYREARQAAPTAVPVLEAQGLARRNGFSNVSFTLHEGEIIWHRRRDRFGARRSGEMSGRT